MNAGITNPTGEQDPQLSRTFDDMWQSLANMSIDLETSAAELLPDLPEAFESAKIFPSVKEGFKDALYLKYLQAEILTASSIKVRQELEVEYADYLAEMELKELTTFGHIGLARYSAAMKILNRSINTYTEKKQAERAEEGYPKSTKFTEFELQGYDIKTALWHAKILYRAAFFDDETLDEES